MYCFFDVLVAITVVSLLRKVIHVIEFISSYY